MAEWTGRSHSKGHDLRVGAMRLSTTDQTDSDYGWCWHVSIAHSYGDDGVAENSNCATEDEAKAEGTRIQIVDELTSSKSEAA